MTAPKLARPAREGEPGYDPQSPSRVYEHPLASRPVVPSITATTDVLSKPGLKYWAAREAAEFAVRERKQWLGQSTMSMPEDKAIKLIKSAPFTEREDSPSSIGDTVHEAIDRFVKTGRGEIKDTWPITAKRMYKQWLAFVHHYRPKFIASEFTVWSNRGYAGSGDLAFRIGKTTILADTKTGTRVYPDSVALQLAALTYADVVISEDGSEKPMFHVDQCAVLHLRPTFAQLIPVYVSEFEHQKFLEAKGLKQWREGAPALLGESPRISYKNEFPGGK